MNKKKTLLFSIITVLVIGLIVSGGTFAYLQWSSGYSAGTSVNVTIEMGGITMHIESEDKEFVGLYPTKIDDASDCDRARFGDALVTIVNGTGTMAVPSFKLKVKVTKGGSDALTKDVLSHIRYSVVPVTTTIDGSGNPVKGNEVSSCYAGVTGGTATGNKYDVESSWTTAGFKFESVSTAGAWTHIPVANDYVNGGDNKINTGYLPRQYNTTTESVSGITFKAPQYSTTYQYYRVYVWLDEGYTTTIIGDTITDPLQNAKIEVMWSEESMVEQVTGSGTAAEYPNSVPMENVSEEELVPGLYDENWILSKSWQQLLDNGDITVVDNVVSDSNRELTGKLLIPEGITGIGTVSFGRGWSIELDHDVLPSKLSEIIIPSTVTEIGAHVFVDSSFRKISFKGTVEQWNAIDKAEFWNKVLPVRWIGCSNGIVVPYDVGYFEDGLPLVYTWDELLRNNITIVDNVVTSYDLDVPGTLVIPEGITGIGDAAFGGPFEGTIEGTTIYIPSSVTSLGNNLFSDVETIYLLFVGTIEQWNAIDKASDWNASGAVEYVECLDGNVPLY